MRTSLSKMAAQLSGRERDSSSGFSDIKEGGNYYKMKMK